MFVTSYIYPHFQVGEVFTNKRFAQESLFVTDIFFNSTIQLFNAGALFVQLHSACFISIFYMLLLIKQSH